MLLWRALFFASPCGLGKSARKLTLKLNFWAYFNAATFTKGVFGKESYKINRF
jgi:hypothetical protein